jgi:quercetin dioxygenase-like cupin family protein
MPIIHSEDAEVKSLYPGFDARFMVDRDHGSQAVTIIDEIFHPGVLIPLHRHKVEGSCFVYAGTGILKIDGEEPHRLEPGMGVLVPANTWHSLENDGKEDLRWITAFPAVDVMREMKGEEQPASTIFQEKDIQPREIFPGVSLVQAVDYDHGSQAITMGKITIEPGCEIPPHTHPVDDAMIILSGSGELYTTEGSVPIETGSHGWAPANTRHGVRNTGKQPLVFIYTWPAANVARIMKK